MNNKKRLTLLLFNYLIVLVFSGQYLSGQTSPHDKINLLQNEYEKAITDSMKIEHLYSIANIYYDYLGDETKADSISEIAVSIAISSYKPEILIHAYNLYIENNDLSINYTKSLDYAQKALQYAKNIKNPKANCRISKNMANVYLAGYNYDKALEYGFRTLSVADGLHNDILKAESYLVIGESLEGKGQPVEAFRNYLNALGIAELMHNKRLLGNCYSQLSLFYQNNKVFDKATHYKLKEGDLIRERLPVDSLAMMWIIYDLQVISMHADTKLTDDFINNILSYASKHKVHRLKEYEMALYRTYLIKYEKHKELYELYINKFPDELLLLKQSNPALFFTLQSYFYEYEGLNDSAYHYFQIAEQKMISSHNKILKSNFFRRFGQFLVRQNKTDEAILKFSKSYDLARESNYTEYMIIAAEQLETLYVVMGHYENAYKFSNLKSELEDKLRELSKKDQMIMMEITHETEQRQILEEQMINKTKRRHNIQYTGMLIGILAFFVILIMFGSFRVPKWVIQMIGFFSFIFFFEFIILLADNAIHHWTHGEPWKILLIKIVLIAFLLPFHHWLEKQVVNYLLNHRLMNFSDFSPIGFLKKITGIGSEDNQSH